MLWIRVSLNTQYIVFFAAGISGHHQQHQTKKSQKPHSKATYKQKCHLSQIKQDHRPTVESHSSIQNLSRAHPNRTHSSRGSELGRCFATEHFRVFRSNHERSSILGRTVQCDADALFVAVLAHGRNASGFPRDRLELQVLEDGILVQLHGQNAYRVECVGADSLQIVVLEVDGLDVVEAAECAVGYLVDAVVFQVEVLEFAQVVECGLVNEG
jgi:hypothetical protein